MIRHAVAAAVVWFAWCPIAAAQEAICDPENPACVEEPATTHSAPPPPTLTQTIEAPEGTSDPTVQALGRWGTQLAVDRAFEGEQEDIVELDTFFDLGVAYEPRDDFRIVVQGQLRHWVGGKKNPENTNLLLNARGVRASYDARVGEAYARWRTNRWSLGVGNLVTRWGSTDITRPGDVINPTDQTAISASSANERLPQLTLDVTYTGRGWSLQTLLVPFFVPNRAWSFGRDTSLLNPRNPVIAAQLPIAEVLPDVFDPSVHDDVQPALGATRAPDEVPKNISLGARLTATFANTDVGIGAWAGWDRTPAIVVDDDMRTLLRTVVEDGQVLDDFDFLAFFLRNPELLGVSNSLSDKAAAGEELFSIAYRRYEMLLLDVARYVGPIGVRADVAMFPRRTYMTEDLRAVRRPTLEASLGLSWERLRSEDDVITVTVEGFVKKPFAADSAVTEAFVAESERGNPDDPLLLIGDQISGVAAATLISLPWKLKLQAGGVFNATHGDAIASVALQRTFVEAVTVGVGYQHFTGPPPAEKLTVGGLYDNNDQLTFSVSGVF